MCRRRDAHAGFRRERENLHGDAKGKGTSGSSVRPKVPRRRAGADGCVGATQRGKARGAQGVGHRVGSGSTANRRNPVGSTAGGGLPPVARAGGRESVLSGAVRGSG